MLLEVQCEFARLLPSVLIRVEAGIRAGVILLIDVIDQDVVDRPSVRHCPNSADSFQYVFDLGDQLFVALGEALEPFGLRVREIVPRIGELY